MKKFFLATQLYMITKNIQSNIQKDFPHILKNAPVIHLQWVSLIHFKTTILNVYINKAIGYLLNEYYYNCLKNCL